MLHCPACGSTTVFMIAGGYTGTRYGCKDCGYCGPLVVEYDGNSDERDDHRAA